jgi:hypothetical protein
MPARCPMKQSSLEAASPAVVVAPDQRDFWNAEGYLSIAEGMTTAEEAAFIAEIYDRAFSTRVGYEAGKFFDFAGDDRGEARLPQLFFLSNFDDRLRNTMLWANAHAVARALLGPGCKLLFEHAMLKPPGGPATPWHQDFAFYEPGERYEHLTIWSPLQDVTIDGGCLQFIPRSFLGPLLPHRPLHNDPKIHALEALGVDASKAVACPLKAGGATVHHHMTLHYAAPNSTGQPRRAYALLFGVKREKPLVTALHPWLAVQRTARREREYASMSLWRKLRRKTRLALNGIGVFPALRPHVHFSRRAR